MTQLILSTILAASIYLPPEIIAGEAPGCPLEAKVAVAHVYANRIDQGMAKTAYTALGAAQNGWYGWKRPTDLDRYVGDFWWRWDDPTKGALWMIGPGDYEKMPWLRNAELTGHWECEHTELWSYRKAGW